MFTQVISEKIKRHEDRSKLAICSTHFCTTKGNNAIVYGDDVLEIPLIGHRSEISALKFILLEDTQEVYLYTASSDYLISWHLEEVSIAHINGEQVRGRVVRPSNGSPHHMTSSLDGRLLCVTSQSLLLIYSIHKNEVLLEISASTVSCTEFMSNNLLLTATFNGNIYIRDLNANGAVLSKYIATTSGLGANFLSVAKTDEYVAVGSSMSMVHEFIFYEDGEIREAFNINLDHQLMRFHHQNKTPTTGTTTRGQVLAMTYLTYQSNNTPSLEFFGERRMLVLATEQAFFCVDSHNNDVSVHGYNEEEIEIGPPVINDAVFSATNDEIPHKVNCLVSFMFEMKFVLFSITLKETADFQPISIISNQPLLSSSPLKLKSKSTSSSTAAAANKSSKSNHKPVTFQNKIKSSGYTRAPRMTMFKPKTNFHNQTTTTSNKKQQNPTTIRMATDEMLPDWSTKSQVDDTRYASLSSKDTCVHSIAINEKKSMIACGLANSTIQVAKIPLPKESDKFRNLTGHNKSVLSCSWSNQAERLLTTSLDNTIKLWTPMQSGEIILDISVADVLKNSTTLNKASNLGDLSYGQFYYIDNFILASVSNSLLMFNYRLHDGPKNDVKRYLNVGKQKLVGDWPMKDAQKITCLSAANNIYSYIVLRVGSNKVVEVFDMNRCEVVQNYKDVHTKPPHVIQHCTGSSSVACLSSDVFMTSALGDGIKLWDVRAQRCVRKYQQHSCLSKCDVTISSCGRYIASGEDEKSICLYDVREEFPIRRLTSKHKTTSLSFSADVTKLYVGNDVSGVRCFHLKSS